MVDIGGQPNPRAPTGIGHEIGGGGIPGHGRIARWQRFAMAPVLWAAMVSMAIPGAASAHGPLFSPSPETIFKGGIEAKLGGRFQRRTGAGREEEEQAAFFKLEYGLAADWQISATLPYVRKQQDGLEADGIGDIILGTKYQFWQRDLPGAQSKASVLLDVKLPTGDDSSTPRIGTGSTDLLGGLAWGYESRRWYSFASGAYRVNTKGSGGIEKGDKQFLNIVGGVRPWLTGYYEPDTVLMLELNWERSDRDRRGGVTVSDSGGWELFASPVLWVTYRNIAFRGGVQIPIAENLNGAQPTSDYRAALELFYNF
ncbi:MAG: hypothetical protein BMS9Abin01_1267 [Gammaproteobacteria bacterium]|nr:MAG: hypothetical protein BMS9Abin01_1267 [Gammaproteobacteria bacterium]